MKGSSERWPKRWLNDDHFLSFSVLTDTSPQRERESSKTTSLLVRNHSFFMAAAAFSSVAACSAASAFATSSFQSLAHFMSTTPNPQERWGTHKKRWPFQPCPFADVIGLVRRSYDVWRMYISYIFVYKFVSWKHEYIGSYKNACIFFTCVRHYFLALGLNWEPYNHKSLNLNAWQTWKPTLFLVDMSWFGPKTRTTFLDLHVIWIGIFHMWEGRCSLQLFCSVKHVRRATLGKMSRQQGFLFEVREHGCFKGT